MLSKSSTQVEEEAEVELQEGDSYISLTLKTSSF